MSTFSNLCCPRLEDLLFSGYIMHIFRCENLIWVRVTSNNGSLVAVATGSTIKLSIQNAESYVGNCTIENENTNNISNLDSILMNPSTEITIEATNSHLTGELTCGRSLIASTRGETISELLKKIDY